MKFAHILLVAAPLVAASPADDAVPAAAAAPAIVTVKTSSEGEEGFLRPLETEETAKTDNESRSGWEWRRYPKSVW